MVLAGKQSLHEFARGSPHDDLPWPHAVSPWSPDRFCGGSSSGGGVSVAAGMIGLAVGTDTGGSIRVPAACCGIVGLKPTYGRVSRRGILPLSFSLDHAGPLTRTVEDCALALAAMSGHDPGDPGSASGAPYSAAAADLRQPVRGLRVGVARDFDRAYGVGAEQASAVDACAAVLRDLGVELVEIALPEPALLDAATWTILLAESYALHRTALQTRWSDFGRTVRERSAVGAFVTGADFVQAQRHRRRLTAQVDAVLATVDAVLCSTSLGQPPLVRDVDDGPWRRRQPITAPFNLTGHPALAVPAGLSRDGFRCRSALSAVSSAKTFCCVLPMPTSAPQAWTGSGRPSTPSHPRRKADPEGSHGRNERNGNKRGGEDGRSRAGPGEDQGPRPAVSPCPGCRGRAPGVPRPHAGPRRRGHSPDGRLVEPERPSRGRRASRRPQAAADGRPAARRARHGPEHRVLSTLWQAFPPAPRSLYLCEDRSVIGVPFQLLEHRSGLVVRGDVLPPELATPESRHALSLELVRTMAAFHAVPPASVGLGAFGRPEGFFARTVAGWRKRGSLVGAADATAAQIEAIARWLERSAPTEQTPTLLHSDIKLDNCMLRPDLRIGTILDWDMATRGDPSMDLATLLSYWAEPGDPPCMQRLAQMPTAADGFLSREGVVQAYAGASGRDLSQIHPWRLLAMLKLGVVFLQLHRNWLRGIAGDARYAEFRTLGEELVAWALDLTARPH
jgi:aminoglycoside phosphotransferase (APT) family kinase protein